MNIVKKKINLKLEALVGRRFNKTTLNAELTNIFGCKVNVSDTSTPDDELGDFNFLCGFDNKKLGIFGYVDIYFLKMRRKGHDGSNVYVTEVSIEFE